MTTRKPHAKKTQKPTAPAPSASFETMVNALAVQKADQEEQFEQEHLTRRAWQMAGLLIGSGVIRLPDFDKIEDQAVIDEAHWIEGTICSIVRAFSSMNLLDDEF